ncbi:protein let-653-like [Clytia hemisphaerica]|uniref:Cnidarian restricted protein n=1 Tax=Clytia hemisphaerica TaxID=252671 RepID=A0A7M5TVW3_9CNID
MNATMKFCCSGLLVFSILTLQINATKHDVYRLVENTIIIEEDCQTENGIEYDTYFEVECLLLCAISNRNHVHFSNTTGKCSCIEKVCATNGIDGFWYQKEADKSNEEEDSLSTTRAETTTISNQVFPMEIQHYVSQGSSEDATTATTSSTTRATPTTVTSTSPTTSSPTTSTTTTTTPSMTTTTPTTTTTTPTMTTTTPTTTTTTPTMTTTTPTTTTTTPTTTTTTPTTTTTTPSMTTTTPTTTTTTPTTTTTTPTTTTTTPSMTTTTPTTTTTTPTTTTTTQKTTTITTVESTTTPSTTATTLEPIPNPPLGLMKDNAASSCKQIKHDHPLSPNGHYWVVLHDNVSVWCDMETDNGGWVKIGRVYIENNASSYNYYDILSNNIKKIGNAGSQNYLLDGKLDNLTNWIGFSEIRMRCTGSSPDHLFHAKIISTKNENSLALFNYYVHATPRPTNLCDAFHYLADDTSELRMWSTEACENLEHGHTTRRNHRLYNNQCYDTICVSVKFLQCDTEDMNIDGTWEFFIR